jgi:hypothetical protein
VITLVRSILRLTSLARLSMVVAAGSGLHCVEHSVRVDFQWDSNEVSVVRGLAPFDVYRAP